MNGWYFIQHPVPNNFRFIQDILFWSCIGIILMILQIGFGIKYSLEIILYDYIVLNITIIKEYVDGY